MNDFFDKMEDELIELGYTTSDIIKCVNDINIRLSWNINSFCSIYSRKNKKWFNGKIIHIFINKKTNQKWFIIQYNNKNTKNIQRFNQNIKPIHFNRNQYEYNKHILKYISKKLKQMSSIQGTEEMNDIENKKNIDTQTPGYKTVYHLNYVDNTTSFSIMYI